MAVPYRSLHVQRAIDYAQGRQKGRNAVPAVIWLWVLLVLVMVIRNGALPSQSQGLTLLIMGGVLVAAGVVLPELVVLLLAGLLLAAVVGLPALQPTLTAIEARVAALTGKP